jgi:hypothetical protein
MIKKVSKRPLPVYLLTIYFAIRTIYSMGVLFLLNIALEGQSSNLQFSLVYSLIIVNIITHFFLVYQYIFAKRHARIITIGTISYSNILAFATIMTYGSLLGVILIIPFIAIPSFIFLVFDGIAVYYISRNSIAQYFKNSAK